jgi:hypothetical protein
MPRAGSAPISNGRHQGRSWRRFCHGLRTFIAVGLACSLAVHALAHSSRAAAYDGKYAQLEGPEPCTVGHRFEPGPIVDGHHRQPTPLEFESRMRQLRALTQTNGGSLGGRAC